MKALRSMSGAGQLLGLAAGLIGGVLLPRLLNRGIHANKSAKIASSVPAAEAQAQPRSHQ